MRELLSAFGWVPFAYRDKDEIPEFACVEKAN